ncbi:MAG: hypothetical protein U5K43_02055 [Halofilum sp. (in: g-proteobacteria)]|nr:hypothetical protein [Halofilum sp. (in: g-proteobacteria)]
MRRRAAGRLRSPKSRSSRPSAAAPAEPEEARAAPAPEQPPQDTAEAAARERAEREQPPRGLSAENLYRLLVADLAGRRGDIGVALQGYLETARESGDPRVAERATRLALYAERTDAALEAAQALGGAGPGQRRAARGAGPVAPGRGGSRPPRPSSGG